MVDSKIGTDGYFILVEWPLTRITTFLNFIQRTKEYNWKVLQDRQKDFFYTPFFFLLRELEFSCLPFYKILAHQQTESSSIDSGLLRK